MFDIEYVDKISLQLDLRIVLITIQKVVSSHGVNANNNMTMDTFKGNTV